MPRERSKSGKRKPAGRPGSGSNSTRRPPQGTVPDTGNARRAGSNTDRVKTTKNQDVRRARSSEPPISKGQVILYGRNSVRAALANPHRTILGLHGRKDIAQKLVQEAESPTRMSLATKLIDAVDSDLMRYLDRQDIPHQHIAAIVKPIDNPALADILLPDGAQTLLVLDQVSDPQNIGAAMRVAAALGVSALVTQDRHSPPETGALARASAGALEILPWVRVNNLSRALDEIREKGFWVAGLDGTASKAIDQANLGNRYALVMGSEGSGIRPLVLKGCDEILKIPMANAVESLNVSVAAGIALYALARS